MRRLLAVFWALALLVSACNGGGSTSPDPTDSPGMSGDPVAGEALYATCASCHGPDATGLEGLGKDLTNSAFLAGLSDDELVAFLKVGRRADDPANTTGVDMPPKGGDPSLSDQDLYDIVAYLRTLPGN